MQQHTYMSACMPLGAQVPAVRPGVGVAARMHSGVQVRNYQYSARRIDARDMLSRVYCHTDVCVLYLSVWCVCVCCLSQCGVYVCMC